MSLPRMDIDTTDEENVSTPGANIRDFTDKQGGAAFLRDDCEHTTAAATEPSPATPHATRSGGTIVIKIHDGRRYVIPYLAWERTALHIEEIYRERHRETLAEAVRKGQFSLMTEDGDIILPSLWNQVVKPATTVELVLPQEILSADINERYGRAREASVASSPYISASASPSVYNGQNRDPRNDDIDSEGGEDLDLESSDGSATSETSTGTGSDVASIREVHAPKDEDGNNLVFKAHTTINELPERNTTNAKDIADNRKPPKPVGDTESIIIAKALSSQAEGRTSLHIFRLKDPRTTSTNQDASIRWFHLRSSPLDLIAFRETCSGLPGLSKHLQELVQKTFDKVEKEKLKISLDGIFIDPGTVVRGDGSDQSNPESVIFSCVPYFDLQLPTKQKSTTGNPNRFLSRTLMQSYYPYEPVQDRDAEQAYRKFGNEQRNALVHVPNLWVVNIGSEIVATCGHRAIEDDFVQSIQIVPFDRNSPDNGAKHIRLTDWDGRRLLYTVAECRSYFQMEQRLKELQWSFSRSTEERRLQLLWAYQDRRIKVTPGSWTSLLKKKHPLFIDISLTDSEEDYDKGEVAAPSFAIAAKPFFQWPHKASTEVAEKKAPSSDGLERSIRCLELVEKAMISEVLQGLTSYSVLEETFSNTDYYRNLAQATAEEAKSSLKAILTIKDSLEKPTGVSVTSHQAVVFRQENGIAQRTSEIYNSMHDTLALFVAEVDKNTMLRKSWAAMQNICDIAGSILRRQHDSRSNKHGWAGFLPTPQKWSIRLNIGEEAITEPLKELQRSFEKCGRCSFAKKYDTSQAALLHAQKHFDYVGFRDASILEPNDCVVDRSEKLLEVINNDFLQLLTKASEKAQQLLAQATELSDGVINDNGQMSDLYTMPRSLLSAFRQLLVFYFAIERSMDWAEGFTKASGSLEQTELHSTVPPVSASVPEIELFAGGVQCALLAARSELCSMAKSTRPVEVYERLSLSPEYVCSWFMRRLIVKPLEKSMTVSDMYREYLSTIQFQVNHRPSKRLLRSINLVQEEIAAVQEVNTQQSKLISNYMSVLDDTTYEKDIPYRRAMFPYERMLLESCQDSLKMTDQECRYLLARCGPLSDSTKQSLEINEEDHGKAILVFTVVTVIFLPLSFVTSYLGMNTTDIRDMGSSSTLFWAIAIPLTAVTMGSVMYIGYNGDDLRDFFSSVYRNMTGKQDRSVRARGISVAQRKMARKSADSRILLDFSSIADEAEFANPRPEEYRRSGYRSGYATQSARRQYTLDAPEWQYESYASAVPVVPEPRIGLRTKPLKSTYVDERPGPGREYSEMERSRARERPVVEYLYPEDDYTARPRVDGRSRTYNEQVSVDVGPVPPGYERMSAKREYSRYARRPVRVSEPHDTAPPHYEWTKQSRRGYR